MQLLSKSKSPTDNAEEILMSVLETGLWKMVNMKPTINSTNGREDGDEYSRRQWPVEQKFVPMVELFSYFVYASSNTWTIASAVAVVGKTRV